MHNVRIALVVSQFNTEITSRMQADALNRLQELRVPEENYLLIQVPGAVEIPVLVKQLVLTHAWTAIVALGAVIRGETDHYDYVCSQVSYGCQKIAIEHQVPVIFGILTCDTQAQAFDRLGGAHGNKAQEAIDTAIHMIHVQQSLTCLAQPVT